MSNLFIFSEVLIEVLTFIGFLSVFTMICVLLRVVYELIVTKINNYKRKKDIRLSKIKAAKEKQRKINTLVEYYNLQAEDVLETSEPNKELLEVCNWN